MKHMQYGRADVCRREGRREGGRDPVSIFSVRPSSEPVVVIDTITNDDERRLFRRALSQHSPSFLSPFCRPSNISREINGAHVNTVARISLSGGPVPDLSHCDRACRELPRVTARRMRIRSNTYVVFDVTKAARQPASS